MRDDEEDDDESQNAKLIKIYGRKHENMVHSLTTKLQTGCREKLADIIKDIAVQPPLVAECSRVVVLGGVSCDCCLCFTKTTLRGNRILVNEPVAVTMKPNLRSGS